jgi:hypothetical protein
MGSSGPESDPRAPSVASRLHGEHSTPAQVRATRRSISRRRSSYSAPDRSLVMAASGQVSRLCDDFARALPWEVSAGAADREAWRRLRTLTQSADSHHCRSDRANLTLTRPWKKPYDASVRPVWRPRPEPGPLAQADHLSIRYRRGCKGSEDGQSGMCIWSIMYITTVDGAGGALQHAV